MCIGRPHLLIMSFFLGAYIFTMICFFLLKRGPITTSEVTEWPYSKVKYHFKTFNSSLKHQFKKNKGTKAKNREEKREKEQRDRRRYRSWETEM